MQLSWKLKNEVGFGGHNKKMRVLENSLSPQAGTALEPLGNDYSRFEFQLALCEEWKPKLGIRGIEQKVGSGTW